MDKYYKLDSEKMLSTMRVYYNDICSRYTYLINREKELNEAHNDVVHYMEFNDVNVVKGYGLYKKLQDIRIERRIVKDEFEEVEPAYEAVKNLSTVMSSISKAQGKCKKAKDRTITKKYRPRANNITGIDDFEIAQEKYAEKLKDIVEYKGNK